GLQDDKYLNKTYSEVGLSLSKLGEIKLIHPIFELLLEKALKIRNEALKVDYLLKLLSYITNFGISEETNGLIVKILSFKNFITENDNLSTFFRTFIISLNKINTNEISFFLEEIENSLNAITDIYLKAETVSFIALAHF